AHIRVLAHGEDPRHPPELDGAPAANANEASDAMADMDMDHGDTHR
ncbi:MAG: hypothetical protein JWM98_1767, partial [Thermoleophilia bacterium]|nr:hypothetical protein [Thermoleophilia bacterium]